MGRIFSLIFSRPSHLYSRTCLVLTTFFCPFVIVFCILKEFPECAETHPFSASVIIIRDIQEFLNFVTSSNLEIWENCLSSGSIPLLFCINHCSEYASDQCASWMNQTRRQLLLYCLCFWKGSISSSHGRPELWPEFRKCYFFSQLAPVTHYQTTTVCSKWETYRYHTGQIAVFRRRLKSRK